MTFATSGMPMKTSFLRPFYYTSIFALSWGLVQSFFFFPEFSYAQESPRGSYRGNFKLTYRAADNELKAQSLNKLRSKLDRSCAAQSPEGCAKLCYWQIMDKDNLAAQKNCQFACQRGQGGACLANNLIKQLNSSRSDDSAVILARYLLDLACKGEEVTNYNPFQMKKEMNSLLNQHSYDLAWSVGLGCKRGYEKSCKLAEYLVRANNLPAGGQDLVQALIDYSCHEHAQEACAAGAIFKSMNHLDSIASELFKGGKFGAE